MVHGLGLIVRAVLQRHPNVVLVVGVIAVSTASVLIRLAAGEGMGALAIAAYRMAIAAAILAPFVAVAALAGFRNLSGARRLQICAAGLCLALHFGTWIYSLQFTSVASSVALVTSFPLWVTLFAYLIFREQPGPRGIAGVGIALAGAVIIFAADRTTGSGSNPTLGNALAVAGALSVSAYILCARAMPTVLGTWSYVWLVYSGAAVLLLGAAAVQGQLTDGVGWTGLGFVLAMALGPQLIGHTTINWAARRIPATLVSMIILGEPVLAAGLAWLVLSEGVGALQLIGFGVTLGGIALCATDKRMRVKSPGGT
jgi:drug/metabolite transporter (DMT)-like permease